MLICLRVLLLFGLVFAVDRTFAAGKVYRCGNQFQDQPCASTINEAARPAATRDAQTASVADGPKVIVIAAARPATAKDRQAVDRANEATSDARR